MSNIFTSNIFNKVNSNAFVSRAFIPTESNPHCSAKALKSIFLISLLFTNSNNFISTKAVFISFICLVDTSKPNLSARTLKSILLISFPIKSLSIFSLNNSNLRSPNSIPNSRIKPPIVNSFPPNFIANSPLRKDISLTVISTSPLIIFSFTYFIKKSSFKT